MTLDKIPSWFYKIILPVLIFLLLTLCGIVWNNLSDRFSILDVKAQENKANIIKNNDMLENELQDIIKLLMEIKEDIGVLKGKIK